MTTSTPQSNETLISITAGSIEHGDLVHYTAGVAWRVEGVSTIGKSIDVDYVCEQDEVTPENVGVAGVHRFRQSTNLHVLRRLVTSSGPTPETLPAGDLNVGDELHYTPLESWSVTGLNIVGKSIDVDFVYTASGDGKVRIGLPGEHRFRQSTKLLVTRGVHGSPS
jgi:hypothetical protein